MIHKDQHKEQTKLDRQGLKENIHYRIVHFNNTFEIKYIPVRDKK